MDDPIWISEELATAIHSRQLAEHGRADGVRDKGLFESALAQARKRFACSDPTPGILALAGAYAFAIVIAKNHAFVDGNKRTAHVVCRIFLMLNGWDMTAKKEERYVAFLSLASGDWDEITFTVWLLKNTKPAE